MCEVKGCRQKDIAVNYLGHDTCNKHFNEHCEGKIDLKKEYGVE